MNRQEASQTKPARPAGSTLPTTAQLAKAIEALYGSVITAIERYGTVADHVAERQPSLASQLERIGHELTARVIEVVLGVRWNGDTGQLEPSDKWVSCLGTSVFKSIAHAIPDRR